jgi:hypothetical protein
MNTILSLVCLLLSASPASAAEVSVVGSLVREHVQRAGDRAEGVILVRNNDTVARDVVVHPVDYRFFADGSNDFAEPGSLERSNAAWVQFSPNQTLVPARSTTPVYYSVTVPDDAELQGSYWSVLMVEARPLPTAEEAPAMRRGVQLNTLVRYGVQIISDIGGAEDTALTFSSSSLQSIDGKPTLVLDIENSGSRQLRPSVWIDLFDQEGARVDRVEASSSSRLLPGCSARYRLDVSHLEPGLYNGLVIADGGDDQVFGTDYALDLRR